MRGALRTARRLVATTAILTATAVAVPTDAYAAAQVTNVSGQAQLAAQYTNGTWFFINRGQSWTARTYRLDSCALVAYSASRADHDRTQP